MKKTLIALLVLAALCLSFFAGTYTARREHTQNKEAAYETMLRFAVSKLEKERLSDGFLEALCSNIYAAYCYCDDAQMTSALHLLWNALVFDGDRLTGNENALIGALKSRDAGAISEIAMRMRTTSNRRVS